jgi:hypothetical protein
MSQALGCAHGYVPRAQDTTGHRVTTQ